MGMDDDLRFPEQVHHVNTGVVGLAQYLAKSEPVG